jgi:hypothetical protein
LIFHQFIQKIYFNFYKKKKEIVLHLIIVNVKMDGLVMNVNIQFVIQNHRMIIYYHVLDYNAKTKKRKKKKKTTPLITTTTTQTTKK